MSFYATITGRIRYPTREALAVALADLRAAGWMNASDIFVDEAGRPLTPQSTVDGLSLRIPRAVYRDLVYRLGKLTDGAEYDIAWVSTDGVYEGVVFSNRAETDHDLEEWAAQRVGPPEDGEYDSAYWSLVESNFLDWAAAEWEIAP
jgi:hypothetical protein